MNKYELEKAISESMDELLSIENDYETKVFKQAEASKVFKSQSKFIKSKLDMIPRTCKALSDDDKNIINLIIPFLRSNNGLLINEQKTFENDGTKLLLKRNECVAELTSNLEELKNWVYEKPAIEVEMELIERLKEEINNCSTIQELPNIDLLINEHNLNEIANQVLRNCWTSQKRQIEIQIRERNQNV